MSSRMLANARGHRPDQQRAHGPVHGVVRQSMDRPSVPTISVDPLILCQGKSVTSRSRSCEAVNRTTERGSLVVFHLAFPSRDREVVKLSELR